MLDETDVPEVAMEEVVIDKVVIKISRKRASWSQCRLIAVKKWTGRHACVALTGFAMEHNCKLQLETTRLFSRSAAVRLTSTSPHSRFDVSLKIESLKIKHIYCNLSEMYLFAGFRGNEAVQ